MAFGFPAHHVEEFEIPSSDMLYRTQVGQRLNQLGWALYSQGIDRIELGTHASLSSWGENVTCEFPAPGRMRVTSKCRMSTQCVDWGQNRRNVQQVRTTLGL